MIPSDAFVPLTAAPAPAGSQEFQVTILNGGHDHSAGAAKSSPPSQTTGFQSLETARPVAQPLVATGEKKIGEPRVTVQRDGDRITHLRIQCSCGQVIDLACVYEGTQNPKA